MTLNQDGRARKDLAIGLHRPWIVRANLDAASPAVKHGVVEHMASTNGAQEMAQKPATSRSEEDADIEKSVVIYVGVSRAASDFRAGKVCAESLCDLLKLARTKIAEEMGRLRVAHSFCTRSMAPSMWPSATKMSCHPSLS